jgi:predicted lipoprotein with Yx(FWY)xxD motif
MTRTLAITTTLAAAAVLAACGGGGQPSCAANAATTTTAVASAPPRPTATATAARGSLVKVAHTEFGRILVDRRGQALYLFTKDRRGPSRCYGDCATAWPPLYTKGSPVAGKDVAAGKLGTVRRRGGRLQVTYDGKPLYYFASDSPGRILCQNAFEFGGTWLVVKPSGAPVR